MDISKETETRLLVARQAIEDLKTTAEGQANSGTLKPDVESLEMDVVGAGSRFLSDTKDAKLTVAHKQKKDSKSNQRRYDPKLSDGWVSLRFRVTVDQRIVIAAAMERAREIAGIEGKLWKGVALEYVAADFLAGHGAPQSIPQAVTDTGAP